MDYQDEMTAEKIMQMDLKEAYEELCIIEDDIEQALSQKGKQIEDIEETLNNIYKIRNGMYYDIYIQHLLDKNYIEKPVSEIVIVNKKLQLKYADFYKELEKRRILIKRILIEYYTNEKEITHER